MRGPAPQLPHFKIASFSPFPFGENVKLFPVQLLAPRSKALEVRLTFLFGCFGTTEVLFN
jgi:hypothetical protein